jgi:hypothetical protein
MVTSHDSGALRRALEATGMQIGNFSILKPLHKAYVNADLFEDYIQRLFLLDLAIGCLIQAIREEAWSD